MKDDSLFLEVDVAQCCKEGQRICGDSFLTRRVEGEGRIIVVLSDGLGSGVKANVLSSMTASMALKFVEGKMEFLRSADVMMDALPVCRQRGISYATFTVVEAVLHGWTRIMEMDNPGVLLVRDGEAVPVGKRSFSSSRWKARTLRQSEVATRPGDRLVLLSDGITQAGMGSPAFPLGWGEERMKAFVLDRVRRDPQVSAHRLSRAVLRDALWKEPQHRPGDDMTCAVLYFRTPRRCRVLTGPPFDPSRDGEFAHLLTGFEGRTVVCGGTTAEIVSRELGRPLETDLRTSTRNLPPLSRMEGVDLVTEGILTLTKARRLLETEGVLDEPRDGARRLVDLLLDSDVIEFVVGTRINEAHQDPSLPVEIEMRRGLVRSLAALLETRYLKRTFVRYL
ncbi:protein serine/threonine phosphatase [Aminomonas paucivorans DSM 12260]|uniref:Protein serine/threonine phosphatase n=1 Tax=Aminomonas paucivorans DSM 12260 TaxID=584708 RepID=E3CZT1_9BACT|nr:SpoIIE family protein phosphatase [Aminomonas paucivorans]EFQ24713.1 protein serine/threonine phosphatase [Aminomonas paucivorans DSM 12260]